MCMDLILSQLSSEKRLLAVDGDLTLRPTTQQCAVKERCGTLSCKWDVGIKSLLSKLKDLRTRGVRKTVR